MSEIDTPAPPTSPSPVLSSSQSWTSGEIPIYLEASASTSTLQLSPAGSASSGFPPAGSVGTFGQPARSNPGSVSRRSHSSEYDPQPSYSSIFWTPTTTSFSADYGEDRSYDQDGDSVLRLSAYLASSSVVFGGGTDGDSSSVRSGQSALSTGMSASSFLSFGKHERPQILKDLALTRKSTLQSYRGVNLIHRQDHAEPDVPLSPTSTFLLSPESSTISEFIMDAETDASSELHVRAVSTPPPVHPYANVLNIASEEYIAPPHPPSLQVPPRPRSNSNPHIPIADVPRPHPLLNIPAWLRNLRIELWIDQEGFRAIQPPLFLTSFSPGTGKNPAGETLDVAEFAMRAPQTWHFHYAPLESAPVLRRLTVNGDMNDYISRQAALSLKSNGVYAVESTEDRGRGAWKLEYRVEDRRAPGSGKIIDGEKCFTLLRFVCNPTLLGKEHGKKVGLLQVVRKSVTLKLQSVRLGAGPVRLLSVPSRVSAPRKPKVLIDHEEDGRTPVQQHIVPPAVLSAMFPVSERRQVVEGGLLPPPRGPKRSR